MLRFIPHLHQIVLTDNMRRNLLLWNLVGGSMLSQEASSGGLFIDEGPFTAMEFIIGVTHIPRLETILMAG